MTSNGDAVVKRTFGASLYDQGRGFYVTLELLALIWGTSAAGRGVLPDSVEPLVFHRRSHDFAQRLATSMDELSREELGYLEGAVTAETLHDLFSSLTVPIPGRRSVPKWGGRHLYPYVGELVHYDAVHREKRGKLPPGPQIERYFYRGGGGLAHKLLRTDPDRRRLDATRGGLGELVAQSDGPLGRLAKALTEHDSATAETGFIDELEHEAFEVEGSPWPELLRLGVRNIVARSALPQARRVESLMHFVPYCVARHQHACALRALDAGVAPAIPVDCRSAASPIREAARASADEAKGVVYRALERVAQSMGATDLLRLRSQKWRESSRGFFAGTLGSVGALNAMGGKRHFCLRTDLLESFVLVLLEPGAECSFEDFCSLHLHARLGVVVDSHSAGRERTLSRINRAEFQENAEELARSLRDLGLLHEFSDATRIVRAEVTS